MQTQTLSNPFALMMDPQAVLQAVERSERMQRLHSRICRPLDKPLVACTDADASLAGDDPADADRSA